MKRRASGVLLHISSLPGPFGIGDFGPSAHAFADFLAASRQTYWQILPLNPTEPMYDNSPYHSISAFAGNPWLISPELLLREGYIDQADIDAAPDFPATPTDYQGAMRYKASLFPKAYERFRARGDRHDFERFCSDHRSWLEEYALFAALKKHFNGAGWVDWPGDIRDHTAPAVQAYARDLADEIEKEKFVQFLFDRQWFGLKRYCNDLGLQIIGDIPIYVDYDSVDVWANQGMYKLGEDHRPYVVAGVPPDYFSETGQLWGNPIYNWDAIRETGFDWWKQRVRRNLSMFDIVRIDHFRGLVAYWEVPAGETTAINGSWVDVPHAEFFNAITRIDPNLPVIAEDLGIITPDVREVMSLNDLPGMKVLMFAFGDDLATNPYVPHNVPRHSIIYTGTHDNNTVRGWFENEADDATRNRLFDYLGRSVDSGSVSWEFIRMAHKSVANTSVVPLQDILGLGQEARMNVPSTQVGNWGWRSSSDHLLPEHIEGLKHITEMTGRS